MHVARRLWSLFEPIHAVTYFAPQADAAARDAGYRGFWMGYVAMRAAPLGEVGPDVVTAAFYGFSPTRIRRALPDAWQLAPPATALQVRLAGAAEALDAALADVPDRDRVVEEAADLAHDAAVSADTAGRVLAAANAGLPFPDTPQLRLWHATTVLREHRGDGHNAALVAAGIGPVAAHVLKEASGEAEADVLRTGRDWSEEQWAEAVDDLRSRGWLDEDGRLTEPGAAARRQVEDATDDAASAPWRALGERRTERLAELLAPLARAVLAAGYYRLPNPIGAPDLTAGTTP